MCIKGPHNLMVYYLPLPDPRGPRRPSVCPQHSGADSMRGSSTGQTRGHSQAPGVQNGDDGECTGATLEVMACIE